MFILEALEIQDSKTLHNKIKDFILSNVDKYLDVTYQSRSMYPCTTTIMSFCSSYCQKRLQRILQEWIQYLVSNLKIK